ncbi:MAG: DMT family transporter [Anaerovoracaceae bacterium]|jgi:drug/metabolite transporter (DMT)-like permease
MKQKTKSNLLLLTAAFIWGSAFVAQKIGGDIGAMTFNCVRNIIGGLFLIPVAYLFYLKQNSSSGREAVQGSGKADPEEKIKYRKNLITGGFFCGMALFAASTLQQVSLETASAGRAGFITSLYAVLVPVLSIILGRRVKPVIWLCVAVGVAGLYLLSSDTGKFRLNSGDVMLMISSLLYAVHILIIDHYTPLVDGVQLSCVQFLFAGTFGLAPMFVLEDPSVTALLQGWIPLLYTGVLSSGIAYTCQIVGLKGADPSEASLILCLESVFSMITGMIVLHETMPLRGYIGCLLIFIAVASAQVLPDKISARRNGVREKIADGAKQPDSMR